LTLQQCGIAFGLSETLVNLIGGFGSIELTHQSGSDAGNGNSGRGTNSIELS
jgi:hypothetical protein